VFSHLPRDRLTALAVFCRRNAVPAGTVLAAQGAPMDRVIVLEKGKVDLVLEGEQPSNPMAPVYVSPSADQVLGMAYVSASAKGAMQKVVQRNFRRQTAVMCDDDDVSLSRCDLSAVLVRPCVLSRSCTCLHASIQPTTASVWSAAAGEIARNAMNLEMLSPLQVPHAAAFGQCTAGPCEQQ
jgi:hypothetical protein